MRSLGLLFGLVVFMLLVLAFAPPLQTLTQGRIYGPNGVSASPTKLPQVTAGDVKRGQLVYLSKCTGCHSPEAKVAPPHYGEALIAKYRRDETLAQVLRTGKHPMPQFSSTYLTDQQLADVIAYMKTLQ